MRQVWQLTAVLALALGVTAAEAEDTVFNVVSPVPFEETSGASQQVRSECRMGAMLPEFIADYAKKGVTVVIGDAPPEGAEGKFLHLRFTFIQGAGGGAWSGPKSVTVKGELWEDGEMIGSFVASRYSGGGAFGGFKGTCSILGRCIKALGKDIAGWLREPTMSATLGDA